MTERVMGEEVEKLADMILARIGQDFDGECHLAEHEARDIAAALQSFQGAREALEPFAATGAVVDQHGRAPDTACWAGQKPAPPITYGHLRAAVAALSAPVEERKGDMVSRDHEPTLRALLEDVPPVLAALINRYGYHADNVTPKDWSEWNDARQLMAQTRAALASSTPESSGQADLERYAALGHACEGNGLGWYEPNGEMRFQPPAEMIAEHAAVQAWKAARERISELEAALVPFAEVGESYEDEVGDDQADWPTLKVGDLRAAARALSVAPAEARGDQPEGEA